LEVQKKVLKENKLKYEGRVGDYAFDENPNFPAGYKDFVFMSDNVTR
jgi:hypothetical protein